MSQSPSVKSDPMLERLYRQMHRIRAVEEAIAVEYPKQKMRCPVHLCIGQEAAGVGVCDVLEPSDQAFSTHRSHGHYLAKGGSLNALLGELYGKATGCSLGKGGSMHLIDLDCNFLGAAPILGATAALAVGAAFGDKLQGHKKVTVAFFGDAAFEEGVVYEAANFAVLKKLPVVLVCENNGLSTCSPLSVRQPEGRSLIDVAKGIGLMTASADGNDVLAIRALADTAVRNARDGKGPTFLEFPTYRWREHCGPNFDWEMGYRSEKEFEPWKKDRDPMVILRRQMIERNAWDEKAIERMKSEIAEEIKQSIRFAEESPVPDPKLMTQHEYA